jgi:tRNA uridine 5-carboxymethylaminomethyl modification enzyme
VKVAADGPNRSFYDLLSQDNGDDVAAAPCHSEYDSLSPALKAQLLIEAKYAQYLKREQQEVEKLRKDEDLLLSPTLDFASLGGLSAEAQKKLTAHRPRTLAEARRIEGITPSALLILIAAARRGANQAVAM